MTLRWTDEQFAEYGRRASAQVERVTAVPVLCQKPAPDYSAFFAELVAAGAPAPKLEHRFHPRRRWRFDAAFVKQRVALEIDGGLWTAGRHSRGSGRMADMEKLSEAAILGWRVVYASPAEIKSGVAADRVLRALQC